jgi:hypothetical protein
VILKLSINPTSTKFVGARIGEFEKLVTMYAKFWPGHVSYAAFHLRMNHSDEALRQLRMAVQHGGAESKIETIVELIAHDVEAPLDGSFTKLRDALNADTTIQGTWQDKLRTKLIEPLFVRPVQSP